MALFTLFLPFFLFSFPMVRNPQGGHRWNGVFGNLSKTWRTFYYEPGEKSSSPVSLLTDSRKPTNYPLLTPCFSAFCQRRCLPGKNIPRKPFSPGKKKIFFSCRQGMPFRAGPFSFFFPPPPCPGSPPEVVGRHSLFMEEKCSISFFAKSCIPCYNDFKLNWSLFTTAYLRFPSLLRTGAGKEPPEKEDRQKIPLSDW